MGIVVEPKEVEKARYINKKKEIRSQGTNGISGASLNAGRYDSASSDTDQHN